MAYALGSPGSGQRAPRITAVTKRLQEFVDSDNIAEMLSEEELGKLGAKVCHEYGIDERSNEDWYKSAKKALDIALQVSTPKNYPFTGAANVKWPLVTVAALQFNARAYPAIVDGDQIVKAKIIGSDDGKPQVDPATGQPAVDPTTGQPAWEVEPGAKREKAERISRHMSYQLTEEMDEWEEDTDTLLMQLPIVGTAFRKVYFDGTLGRNKSEMVAGTDVVVNRATRALETAPRITHKLKRYPIEIQERQLGGLWLKDFEPGTVSTEAEGDEDAPHEFLEQHRYIDLDGDGYREPYCVTVHKESEKVVRIVASYGLADIKMGASRVERIKRRDYFVKYGFIPDPSGGFYDIGFGRLLESLGASIDAAINMLLNAGHLQTAGGGFIGAGLRLKKGEIRVEPGKYMTVDAPGRNIREAIVNHEHPDPSAVLFNLLGLMIDAAKDITAVQDILTGDSGGKTQTATTTLALIEQGMKVFTAIYKRIYRSLKQEFKLLFRLNAENLPEQAYFTVLDEQEAVARADYEVDSYDVCPQADPRLVTDMQRLARAQALMETLAVNPGAAPEILRRYYTRIGEEEVDKLIVQPQPDPMAMAAGEAEVRKTNAVAAKDETQAMVNIDKIEQGIDQQGENARQFDETQAAGERRAGEARQAEASKAAA